MAWSIPWNLLGLQVSGDFADLTIYTDRNGKKVAFPRSPPTVPSTPSQVSQRLRFKTARLEWSNQTDQVKTALEELCNQAGLAMTGQNLWISVALRHNVYTYATLQRQTGISVPTPTLI